VVKISPVFGAEHPENMLGTVFAKQQPNGKASGNASSPFLDVRTSGRKTERLNSSSGSSAGAGVRFSKRWRKTDANKHFLVG